MGSKKDSGLVAFCGEFQPWKFTFWRLSLSKSGWIGCHLLRYMM